MDSAQLNRDIQNLAERIKRVQSQGLNEANTKAHLVMPFIKALGYNIYDFNEVYNEYTSDHGIKQREKVDIAIKRNGQPVMFIECKRLGAILDNDIDKHSQLYRYFNADKRVKIGILTDGREYLFFTDNAIENTLDDKPFMKIDLLYFDDNLLPLLLKFTRDLWDLSSIKLAGQDLVYVQGIKELLRNNVKNPSETFASYCIKHVYSGKVTSRVINEFKPIIKQALMELLQEQSSKPENFNHSYSFATNEFDKAQPTLLDALAESDNAVINFSNNKNTTGTKPKRLIMLGEYYKVNHWKDVLQYTLETILKKYPDNFEALASNFPKYIKNDDKDLRNTFRLSNGYFVEKNLSAESIKGLCLGFVECLNIPKNQWTVECRPAT